MFKRGKRARRESAGEKPAPIEQKRFRIGADDIKPVCPGYGSCIASDRITVDGRPVGYAYREEPDSSIDSGWRFFAGDESQQYSDDASNFGLYDVNTIANYDPEIIAILDARPPAQFERGGSGQPLARI